MIIVLAPKSHPKQPQNHSKTPPKSIPKTHRKSTPNFTDFGFKMTPQMTPEILQNRPGGHCGAIWDPKRLKREVPPPPGTPKWRSGHPPGHHFHHFWNLFWMFFNIIHDLLSTCNCRFNGCRRITKPMKIMHLSTKTTTGDGPPGEIDCRRPRPRPTTTGDDHGRRVTW